MKKRVLILLIFILIISSVYAYSAREFLEDYKNIITIKAVKEPIDEKFNYILDLTADKAKGEASLTVNFNIKANFKLKTCNIDFGDKSSFNKCNNIKHTYTKPGRYNVVLNVESLNGKFKGEDSLTIEVLKIKEIEIPEIDGYLNVATLKNEYKTGEAIKLTDPPVEKKENFFEKISKSFKNLFNKIAGRKVVSLKMDHDNSDVEISNLNNRLLQIKEDYKKDSDEEKLIELIEISKERKEKLISLMKENPSKALENVISEETRNSLPSEVQDNIEQEFEQEGILEVWHSDDFEHPENSKFYYYLRDENFNKIEIFPTENLNLISGARIRLKGYKLEENILAKVNEENFQVLSSAELINENIGEQKTLVILMNYIDENGNLYETISKEEAEEAVFKNANDYYWENSYNKTWLTGDIVGHYQTNIDCSQLGKIREEGIKLADSDVYFPDYGRIIIFYPSGLCGGIAGWASLGKESFLTEDGIIRSSYSVNTVSNLWVVGHELGHNFGALHANLLDCSNIGYFDPDSCSRNEYGDPFDIMGNVGTRNRGLNPHLNAYHKKVSGFLPRENSIITVNGEYDLEPIEISSYGIQYIDIPIPGKLFRYSLEYRQPIGFDKSINDELYEGVLFHIAPHHTYSAISADTSLYYPNDIVIKPGQVFEDNLNNIKIETLSAYGSYIKVKIESEIEPFVDLVESIINIDKNILNKPATIRLHVENIGPLEASNITINLYKNAYTTKELVATNYINLLPSNREFIVDLNYTPNEVDYFSYLIELDVDNDINLNNNRIHIGIFTFYDGIYLSGALVSEGEDLTRNNVVGKPIKIFTGINNYKSGRDALNTGIKIYEAEKICDKDNCEYNKIRIVEEEKFDILAGSGKFIKFNYTPNKPGINYLLMEINHPDNLNPQKEFYYEMDVAPGIKSLINNMGEHQINGYLLLKTQKDNNGNWEDYQIVLDDLTAGAYGNPILRIINPREYTALDLIFNPYNIKIDECGDYRIYAAFRNHNGEIIETKSRLLEDNYEFKVKDLKNCPEKES